MTNATDKVMAYVRAEITKTFSKLTTIAGKGGEKDRKLQRLDLTLSALEYETPLRMTIWGDMAKQLKTKAKEGKVVELATSLFREEWKDKTDESKENSMIKLMLREESLNLDEDDDLRHYIKFVDADVDPGVMVNASGEVVYVGEKQTRGSGDTTWETRSIMFCPYVQKKDGSIGRGASLPLEITGDLLDLDIEVNSFIDVEGVTIRNENYKDSDGSDRWKGYLRTVQDSDISILEDRQAAA